MNNMVTYGQEMSPDKLALLASRIRLRDLEEKISPQSWMKFAAKYHSCLNDNIVFFLARSKMSEIKNIC